MAPALPPFAQLSDRDLLEAVKRLADDERQATSALIRSLMELDTRRLYLGEGFPSLFAYCTQVLRLSEHAAYNRIEVARAGRKHPRLIEALERGDITLSAARVLGPHLTHENCEAVLAAARHRNKRGTEELVATLRPSSDAPAIVRRLPAPAVTPAPPPEPRKETAAPPPTLPCASTFVPIVHAAPRPAVTPLAPERYRIQFTAGQATHDKLRRAQDLLRHVVPNGDPAAIFDRALTVLLKDLERTRLAAVERPQAQRSAVTRSRHIPAAVRRAVWTRDGGRCAFVGSRGRCGETGFLEWHHVVRFADGGAATTENIELRCRAHNAFEAALVFGDPAGADSAGRPGG